MKRSLSIFLMIAVVFATSFSATEGKVSVQKLSIPATCGKSVNQLIKGGNYHWSNPGITPRNFPTSRCDSKEVLIIVHFDRYIRTKAALSELDKMGLRPAELSELLAYGSSYQEKYGELDLVALGSPWYDSEHRYVAVPAIITFKSGGSLQRSLTLTSYDFIPWFPETRFAAVRKSRGGMASGNFTINPPRNSHPDN